MVYLLTDIYQQLHFCSVKKKKKKKIPSGFTHFCIPSKADMSIRFILFFKRLHRLRLPFERSCHRMQILFVIRLSGYETK